MKITLKKIGCSQHTKLTIRKKNIIVFQNSRSREAVWTDKKPDIILKHLICISKKFGFICQNIDV